MTDSNASSSATAVSAAPLTLPDLPYAYDALEPWCSAETLELHHDRHHKAYVTGANAALEELASADPSDARLLAALRSALDFNMGGHVLHSLFWRNLSPAAQQPEGAVASRIDGEFGGIDRFTALMKSACMGVQGSGWGALLHDPMTDHLVITGIHDHQSQVVPGSHVLAVIDVWEHAYYVDHRNDRAGWVDAAIEHLDWNEIGRRLTG